MFDATSIETWSEFKSTVPQLGCGFLIEGVRFCSVTYSPNQSTNADMTMVIEFESIFHINLVSVIELWERQRTFHWSFRHIVLHLQRGVKPSVTPCRTGVDSYIGFFFDQMGNLSDYRKLKRSGFYKNFKQDMALIGIQFVKLLVHPRRDKIIADVQTAFLTI